MSLNVQICCCNPFKLPGHHKTEGLRPPSKRIARDHPWLTTDHLLCGSCRKKISSKYSGADEWGVVGAAVEYSGSEDDSQPVAPTLHPGTSQGGKQPRQMLPVSHTITYAKLIVPEGMRSMYWKHFGFPADEVGTILTKDRIVCTLCMTTMAYKGNTTNLRMHLKNKHFRTLQILESTPPEPPSGEKKSHKRKSEHGPVYSIDLQGTLDLGSKRSGTKLILDHLDPSEAKEPIENMDAIANNLFANTPTAKTRRKHLNVPEDTLRLITSELLPPTLIQAQGFLNFIEKINPGVFLPSVKQLKDELIPLKFNELRNVILSELSNVGELSISVEEWTGIDSQVFVTISANFLQDDKLVSRILNTLQLNEINPNSINNIFASWGLQQDHIVAIVTATGQASLLEALQQWATAIPCFLYTIQQAVAACFGLPNVEVLLWKCRTIVAKHSGTGNLISNIPTDYPKIWTSTYDMLKGFADNKQEVDAILMTDEVKLTLFDWDIIKTIMDIFSPFKVTIQTLQEESPGLSSIIKPLFWQLITNYLQIKDDETEFPYTVKTLLKSKLLFAYNNQTNNLLLQTATTLDPRFKQVSYSTQEERSVVDQNIKTMLAQFGTLPALPVPTTSKKVTGMEILLGAVKQDMLPKDRADYELSQYTSENPVAFDQNPLMWWRSAELKYPTLIRLARTFMCIPACSIPSSKAALEHREKFERQRSNLSIDIVDKMIFLNGNFV